MGRVDDAMQRAARAREEAEGPVEETEAPLTRPAPAERGSAAVEFQAEEGHVPHLRPVTGHPRALATAPPELVDKMADDLSRKVVVDREIDPASREQYRRLAASLHAGQIASGLKIIMVGSAVAGEGKSLTAANLALTLSESYRRNVLLVDGDLRRPSQHVVFGLEASPGLTDGLDGHVTLHRVTPCLTVLTAGEPTNDPMAVLTSSRMARLLGEARQTYDWVIIDTSPVGLTTDAKLLAETADGTLFVVRADATPFEVVQRAIASIGRERVLGVVLNRAETPESRYGYDTYYQAPPGTS